VSSRLVSVVGHSMPVAAAEGSLAPLRLSTTKSDVSPGVFRSGQPATSDRRAPTSLRRISRGYGIRELLTLSEDFWKDRSRGHEVTGREHV